MNDAAQQTRNATYLLLRAWINAGTDRVDLMGTPVEEPVTDLETMLAGLDASARDDERRATEAQLAALRAAVADATAFASEVKFRLEAPTENMTMTMTDSYTWACGIVNGTRRVGGTTWAALTTSTSNEVQ